MTWGSVDIVYHPADERLARTSPDLFDPWEAAAAQNQEDCARADAAGVLNPPMDIWEDTAIGSATGILRPGSEGPRPPEFHSALALLPPVTQPRPTRRSDAGPAPASRHCWSCDSPVRFACAGCGVGFCDDCGCVCRLPAVDGRRLAPSQALPAPSTRARSLPAWPAGLSPTDVAPAAKLQPKLEAARAEARPTVHPSQDLPPEKADRLRRVLTRAGKLGMLGPLPGPAQDDTDSQLAQQLRDGVRQRARETYDLDRLETALVWFGEFLEDSRREPPFRSLQFAGDLQAMVYNQETLDMLAEYVRRRGSRLPGRKGDTIKSDTISAYVGQIKKLRTHEAHHAIVDTSVNVVGPAAHKRMRQLDGPPGHRQLRLGLRARHLRKIAALGAFDRCSRRGSLEWAAALLAHNLLLRGGEVGIVDGGVLDTARDLVVGAIEFREPCEESTWMPWLVAELVPIKDTTSRRRSAVMPVRRRSNGACGADPMCVYDAIVMAMRARTGRLPPTRGRVQGADALLPLFTGARGHTWTTADTRRLAQKLAGLLGLDPSCYGAKSFRIGGATDYRAVYGPAAAERMIRQRGRWWSDIHALYERALAEEHLAGSAAVADATGAELEALCPGWAQPATFR